MSDIFLGIGPYYPPQGHESAFSSQSHKILKLAYYRNYRIDSNQILHSDRLPNALHGWFNHSHNKSKMANGRHLGKIEKSSYLGLVLTDFDEIWQDDAVWLI